MTPHAPSGSLTILGPAPGPDDPIGMLKACHRRLESRLDTLRRVTEVYQRREEDRYDQAAGAIGMVIRHMQGAGRMHTEDEEFSLFPRLVEADADFVQRLLALEAEHETIESLWDRLRPTLQAIAEGADPEPAMAAGLARDVAALEDAYLRHIRTEEETVLTPAVHVLSDAAIAAIGEEMAARRHLV